MNLFNLVSGFLISVISFFGFGSSTPPTAQQNLTAQIASVVTTPAPTVEVIATVAPTPEITPTPSPTSDQLKEISKLKKEIEVLKSNKPKVVYKSAPTPAPINNQANCESISLNKYAPGYSPDDLQRFLDNNQEILKNTTITDGRYIIDTYFASQWETAMPECEAYINKLVESRRAAEKQAEQLKKISDQQEKLLEYNQCLLSSDRSTCSFLLY